MRSGLDQHGARPDGTGSREPSPSVSALTGFDPSRVRLNGWEVKALTALATAEPDHFWPFARIERESGLPRHHVRRIVRLLARKGLARFSAGLWTDDGEPAGAGYQITEQGRSLCCA